MSGIRILMIFLSIVASIAPPAAGDAQSDFKTLFGEQFERVRATAAIDDDVELAGMMVDMAGELEGQKELKILMYSSACELAARAPEGQKIVYRATKQLDELAPKDAKQWREYRISSLHTVYAQARGKAKARAGESYMSVLVKAGDEAAAAGEGKEAQSLYSKALAVASSIRSKRKTEIVDKIRGLAAAIQKNRAFNDLKERLKKDPKDVEAREALILLHLLENDDSVSAQKLLTDDVDESLRKHVRLAAKGVSDVEMEDCLKLAEWYRTLAESQTSQVRRGVAYRRAHDYYAEFRAKYTKSDTKALKAKLAQASLARRLEAIKVKLPDRRTLVPPFVQATIYWLMADDMDIYHNGKPLREYKPSFRTRRDEARMRQPFSAKIKLRPGDVFTVGGRRGGSYGGTVVVVDKDDKLIWCSNTTDWKVYKPADPEKWYLPEVAMKSKQWPVRVARSFGHQLTMKRKYDNVPVPIWDDPSQRFVFMVGVYKPKAR